MRLEHLTLAALWLTLLSCSLQAAENKRIGISQRTPWTTSRIHGAPEPPPPYQVRPAFPNRKFAAPLLITNWAKSKRLFVGNRAGQVHSFEPDRDGDEIDLFVDMKQLQPDTTSFYGMAFHPQVAKNGLVYVCYVVKGAKEDGTRVSQFQIAPSDPPRIDPSSEKILLTWYAGGHNGGCLKFGPDGYLYISTGDASGPAPPDQMLVGQDVTNLMSAILRIDVDKSSAGRGYRIPPDNPFVDLQGARGEIWAYGFRNPWKMSFDRETGELWVGDVGWELWEMIYRVQRGGNYGWSIMEGRQPVLPEQNPGPTPILPPTIDHPHSEAGSITGGFVYRGSRIPELVGSYIYGDYQSGVVWAARAKDGQVTSLREIAQTPLQLVGFSEDNDAELYLLDHRGRIFELIANPAPDRSKSFPRKLSQTGLFESVARQRPAAGVISYSINAEHWADHTRSERWLAVPGDKPITVDDKGNWQFPDGSVVAKTVSIDHVLTGAKDESAGVARRLETQIMHREDGSWRPYTYAWNEDQNDAELVDATGFTRPLRIRDKNALAGVREQSYRFASRQECTLCHNPWVEARTTIFGVQSASLLGVRVEQLKRDHRYAEGDADQLATLARVGLLDPGKLVLAKTAPLTDPRDSSASLEGRVRSYFQVNCAHCHAFNAGGVANIALGHDVAVENMKLIGVRPTQGTFGIADATLVAPGRPFRSVLYYRVAKLGGGRMPRVGSHEIDDDGVRLIHDWIALMDPPDDVDSLQPQLARLDATKGKARAATITELASTTRGALAMFTHVSSPRADRALREQVASLTKSHPRAEVRDLFERFVPPSQRIKRLGANVDRAELLSLESNAARGKQVFFDNSAAACKNCHLVDKVGGKVGPDLTEIGKKYPRGQLLEHILTPSRFMEPKYVPYLLETADGRVLSGLLEKQTKEEVVLRDAKDKLHRLPADEVELLVRQQKSLMPELLLRDLTKQEVADLLAYLAGLGTRDK
ncbi:MAG: PQQ-dependent sugar dehydrogenase [Pirellulaceae bacterium]|jgi:uncharacterized repeat protein (TIGR03806 family)|nr:PQQ-dependent sugar dehydrogenase [Pirellulaceae bacterium]MDP7019291.1 PQQ-dependent sugar dehydrogenase [Pirellulaceae bacterium]